MPTVLDYPSLVMQIRRARNLTQEQLAHELGVTFGTVNGWENGKHQPSPLAAKELLKIASEAGIDVSDMPGLPQRRSQSPSRNPEAGQSAGAAKSSSKQKRKA